MKECNGLNESDLTVIGLPSNAFRQPWIQILPNVAGENDKYWYIKV